MKLRPFQKEDSTIVCGWIPDEKALYQWSADRIGHFPLRGEELAQQYDPTKRNDRFVPLSAVDDAGALVGHLLIRCPDAEDARMVRFGFVIVDPTLRGQGYGKQMLRLAACYAAQELHAQKITLGVFENNPAAKYCYEAAGFRTSGEPETYSLPVGVWKCIPMEMTL